MAYGNELDQFIASAVCIVCCYAICYTDIVFCLNQLLEIFLRFVTFQLLPAVFFKRLPRLWVFGMGEDRGAIAEQESRTTVQAVAGMGQGHQGRISTPGQPWLSERSPNTQSRGNRLKKAAGSSWNVTKRKNISSNWFKQKQY